MKPFAGNPLAHVMMLFVSLLERSFIQDGEIFLYRWANDIFIVTHVFLEAGTVLSIS